MQETYTDWTLVSESPFARQSLLVLTLAVLAAAIVVGLSYRGSKHPWWLLVLRLLSALLVLGFVVEPALQLRAVRKIRNRLAIVVDTSRSMTLATDQDQTRYDNALAALQRGRPAIQELARAHVVEFFDLNAALPESQLNRPPQGDATDLLRALEGTRDAGAGRPLAGIVLISDGTDNAQLARENESLAPQIAQRLQRLGAPVSTVDAARSGTFNDVAITDVIADAFAFVHNTHEIDVVLTLAGRDSLTVPVTLEREGDVVATQEIQLKAGQEAHALFKSKPDRIGEFVYTVRIPGYAGEAIRDNNVRHFAVQVIRDKIRVLQVAGRPSWDERFLRQHLKENPNVDLISFFILRTPTDDASVVEKEMSLIPFPVSKLFTTELHTFDVVILQNFDYRPYPMARYLQNIRSAVNDGLGFVMIGGEQSFGDGYLGTPIDEILPVSIAGAHFVDADVQPVLTPAGRRHPVTDIGRGIADNEALWRNLPHWWSQNITPGLKDGATLLLRSTSPTGPPPAPLIAVMEAGKGRSMAICTDSMWRWRFSSARDGGASERAYHRFWSNALRWLVRDPKHGRVRVLPSERHYEENDEVALRLQVLGRDYQPLPGAQLRVVLERAGEAVLRTDDVTTDDAGSAHLRYGTLPPGAYRVTARTNREGESEPGKGVFVVESRILELSQGAPRPDLLRAIAKATGGDAFAADEDFWTHLELIDPDVVEINRRHNVDLWDNTWALLAGVLLFAAEWALRRRRGYL